MNWYKKAQDNSSEFKWHYDVSEMFEFVMSRWDVRMAKAIIHETPRPVLKMSLEGLKSVVPERPVAQENGLLTMHPGISVDWDKIDSEEIDLSIPVIVVTRKNGSTLPIDGWHRIAKAMDQGIGSLPAVLLNEEETERVQI